MIRPSSANLLATAFVVGLFGLWFGVVPGGDQLAIAIMTFAAVAFAIIGLSTIPLREANAAVPDPNVSTRSFWPLCGAVAIVFAVLGFSVNGCWTIAAGVSAVIAAGGALGQSWREDLGWNAHFGERVGERIVRPFGLPVVAVGTVAVVAISVSRVLLTNNEKTSVIIAVILAAALLLAFSVLATLKKVSTSFLMSAGIFAVLAIVVVGVISANTGEKKEEVVGNTVPIFRIYAKDVKFVTGANSSDKLTDLTLPANKRVDFIFQNLETDQTVFHNVSLYGTDSSGKKVPIFAGTPIHGGKKVSNLFTAPKAGTYTLHCDFHPAMVATVEVTNSSGAK